ncbi:uncharacterized protein METZ01_LOCUS224188, partial [marine metagenome]
VLIAGCAVEEQSTESAPTRVEVKSQATNAPAVKVEQLVIEAKVPSSQYQGPVPDI